MGVLFGVPSRCLNGLRRRRKLFVHKVLCGAAASLLRARLLSVLFLLCAHDSPNWSPRSGGLFVHAVLCGAAASLLRARSRRPWGFCYAPIAARIGRRAAASYSCTKCFAAQPQASLGRATLPLIRQTALPFDTFPRRGKVLESIAPSFSVIPSHARDLYKNVVHIVLEILRLRFAPLRMTGNAASLRFSAHRGARRSAPCHPERAAERERRRAERVFALPRAGQILPIQLNKLHTALAVFRHRFLDCAALRAAPLEMTVGRTIFFPSVFHVVPPQKRLPRREGAIFLFYSAPQKGAATRKRARKHSQKNTPLACCLISAEVENGMRVV